MKKKSRVVSTFVGFDGGLLLYIIIIYPSSRRRVGIQKTSF
jgi:hypothetical protein